MVIFCILCVTLFWIFIKEEKRQELFLKYEKPALFLLFFIGILIRVFYFWEYPAGLNQDEASIGYDIFADFAFGMDRNGYHNPVYSVAWGSGHAGLYIGLSKPLIAIFGLSVFSVRLLNVLFGCIGLFAFYGICKKLKGKEFALLGLFFFVINPWHIMMSRWGLECNLFPNVFLIGFYFLMCGREKFYCYYIASFFFALSLYAYGTSYMFIPVFLLVMVIYLLKKKEITVKNTMISGGIFLLTAVPILIFMAVNFLGVPEMDWGIISFPKLVEGRYYTTVTTLGGNLFQTILENLKTLWHLIFYQIDGLIWNAVPKFGVYYLFTLPFILLGFINILKEKGNPGRFVLLTMLPASLVLAANSSLNINRANVIFILLIYLAVEGLFVIKKVCKKPFYLLMGFYGISFCLFCGTYFTSYQKQVGQAFFDGFGEAIEVASDETEGQIYLTNSVNMPYIFALFYEEIDSRVFISTVDYMNETGSVRWVNSFDRFVTGIPSEIDVGESAAYVTNAQEAQAFDDRQFEKKQFDYYFVITPR